MEVKKGIYERMYNISLLLKITVLLSLLALFVSLWFLFLTAALIICDIFLSYYRSGLLFTYIYSFSDDVFYVKKRGLDGKESVLEEIPVTSIVQLLYGQCDDCGKRYFSSDDDRKEDQPLTIQTANSSVIVLSDLYLYSIMEARRQELR